MGLFTNSFIGRLLIIFAMYGVYLIYRKIRDFILVRKLTPEEYASMKEREKAKEELEKYKNFGL